MAIIKATDMTFLQIYKSVTSENRTTSNKQLEIEPQVRNR